MQRYLVHSAAGHEAAGSECLAGLRPKQKRLADCKHIVRLTASKYVIDEAEVESLRDILDCPNSSEAAVLQVTHHH
jgi:hypothetical protein